MNIVIQVILKIKISIVFQSFSNLNYCKGHGEGELWGLACHPTKLEFCTASDDQTLRVWSIENKRRVLLQGKVFDKEIRSCQYSPNGKLIAIGFKNGQVSVVKSENLEIIDNVNHRKEEISDLKFSPGKFINKTSNSEFFTKNKMKQKMV